MPDVDMPEGQMRLMPFAPPAPQRIPGRLRSQGPFSQPDVLLTADPQLSTFPCQTLW